MAVGGIADGLSRVIQKTLSVELNTDVIVQNHSGAAGEIGASYVANNERANVLLLASVSLATNNLVHNKLYRLEQDLQPVFYFGHIPMVLVTGNASPYRSLKDLSNSNTTISIGNGGHGTSSHLSGWELGRRLQLDTIHVPYKGGGQAVMDLINNNLNLRFINSPVVVPYVQAGQMRALGVASNKRLPSMPNVPTFQELGLDNFGFKTWFMLLANQNIDPAQLSKIQKVLIHTMTDSKKSQPYQSLDLEYNHNEFTQGKLILNQEIKKYQQFYKQHPELLIR
jgi:tripartite-type tricarboxylate transporter receptor subunit TctC